MSGAGLGLMSGLTSPLPTGWRWAGVAGIALLGVLRELGLVRVRLPQNSRQIPQDVLQRHPLTGAFRFGVELGTGVRTYVSASAPYVLAGALLLAGQRPAAALLAGLGFGAGRAATPLLRHFSRAGGDWDLALLTRIRAIAVTSSVATLLAVVLTGFRIW